VLVGRAMAAICNLSILQQNGPTVRNQIKWTLIKPQKQTQQVFFKDRCGEVKPLRRGYVPGDPSFFIAQGSIRNNNELIGG